MASAHGSPDSQAGMLLFRQCTKTSVQPPNRSDLLKCFLSTWDAAVLQPICCLLLLSLAVPFKSTSSSCLLLHPSLLPSLYGPAALLGTQQQHPHLAYIPCRGVSPPSEPFLCRRMTKHLLCSIIRTAGMWRILLPTARCCQPLVSSSVIIRDPPLLPQHLYFFGDEARSPTFEAVPQCVRLGMTPPSFSHCSEAFKRYLIKPTSESC